MPSTALLVLLLALNAVAVPAQAPADANALAKAVAATAADGDRSALVDANPSLVTRDLVRALIVESDGATRRGDVAEATRLARFAVGVADRAGDATGAINATMALGTTLGRRGEYATAMASFRDAFDRASASGDLVAETISLNNMGIVHRRLGELDLSLDDYAKSLALAEKLGDLPRQANTLNNIGIVLVQQGKYRSASEYYERSLSIKRRLGTPDVLTTVTNIGELQEQQGDLDLALKYFEDGLSLARASQARLELVSPLNGIGRISASRGQYAKALDYYGRALAITEQATDKDGTAVEHFLIGGVLTKQGRLDEALERITLSLALREAIGDTAGQAESLTARAGLELARKEYDAALKSATRAAEIAVAVTHRVVRWQALTVAGRAEQALGHDERARVDFVEATADIEAMRDEVAGGDEATEQFFSGRLDPYYALIDLHVAAGRTADALAMAERVRSRVLLDALRFGRVDVTKSLTAAERDRERDLARVVADASAKLDAAAANGATPKADVDRFTAAVAAARLTQTAYRSELYSAHPELQIRRGDVPAVTIDDMMPLLPAGKSAALEFAVGADRTYLFVLRRTGDAIDLTTFTIRVARQTLTDRVERFRQRLASRDLEIRTDARALYALLLGPAARVLADRTSLTILPDGPLWSLPFQALDTGAGRYLVEQAAVSYAPSLAALREMHQLNGTRLAGDPRRTLLALGSSGAGSRAVALGSLPALVEAERQARAVAAVYAAGHSTVKVGADATRLPSDLGQYRIVHIAAHGIFDDVSPMHSYMVLARPPSAGTGTDGYLEAADLVNMDVQADLVVLSSCDTARGHIGRGEGLIGFSWALFVAGSPSVVVSQWKVDSASTTELMRVFHQRIAAGVARSGMVTDRAAALRQASLALLKNPATSHPFYWAPFVLIGDGT